MRETSAGRASGAGFDRDDARHAEYRWGHAARPSGPDLASEAPNSCVSVSLPPTIVAPTPRRPSSATKIVPRSVSITRFHRASKNASGCIRTLSLRPTGSNRGAVVGLLTTSARVRTRAPWPASRPRVRRWAPLADRLPPGCLGGLWMARWTQCRGTLLLILHVELADRPVTDYGRLRRC